MGRHVVHAHQLKKKNYDDAPFTYDLKSLQQLQWIRIVEIPKRMISDPHGTLSNWTVSGSDLCSWSGVTCVEGEVHIL
ncbi:hypothetical protein YC2023_031526 [Brassica napus]